MNGQGTILAVDDTPESLALLVKTLRTAGYQVRPADSGELALAAVAANPPDLILLDVRMKGVDGLEVCRRLKAREETNHIPIILISAFADAKEWVAGLQLGAADYITKPFQIEELLTRVRTHLALRRANVSLERQAAVLRQANDQLQSELVERRRVEDELRQSLEEAARSRRAMLGIVEDQEQTEMALRASEKRLADIIFSVADWMWEVDENGVYTYSSEKSYDLFGLSPEDVIGKTPFDLMPPDEAKRVAAIFSEIAADKAPIKDLENWNIRKDGERICLLTNGVPILDETGNLRGYRGVDKNITERKQTEVALHESEGRLRAIFEGALDGIMVVEGKTRKVLTVNPAMCRMLGYSLEEITGLDVSRIHPKQGPLNGVEEFGRALRGEIAHTTGLPMMRKDGSVFYADARGAPIRLESKDCLLGIFSDITERKRADEEKTKLEDQLQQAQKMESVGRLAGGVAHDFNNMLGVILGHAELAIEQVDPAQPLHADLTEIRDAAIRSADLTRQLLAFARKQTIAPKVLDLNETVAGMLKMLQRLISEDIDLKWQPTADLWSVKVDPSQIDQILVNLCVNARDAISGVGKMTIETGNSTLDEDYCAAHAGCVPGQYVLLAVSDDGFGMDKKTLSHIFEPFFTTKAMGKGTGLGLATVYGIVKQNNGFIDVYSEPNHGTTFKIYLPRHADEARKARTEGAARPLLRGHETILLVEDEQAILTLTRRMLEHQGYTVLAARTSGEALRLATEHTGEIDLLITDVIMPEMNGRTLAKNMLSLYPHVKRLFMSGYTADVIAHHGVLDEGVHFIQKPFSTEDLGTKVRDALEALN